MRSFAACWIALASIACGTPPTPTVALGPFEHVADPTLFQRTVESVQANGYRVSSADMRRGRIVVASRATVQCRQPARFVVSFHHPSSIRVAADGCAARIEHGRAHMPDSVYRDYVEFTSRLLRWERRP